MSRDDRRSAADVLRALVSGRRSLAQAVRRETGAVIALLGAAFGAWLFLEVADEVAEGETERFDRRLLMALRAGADGQDPLGPHWLQTAAADITALGSTAVLVLVVLFVAGLFTMLRRRGEALLLLVAAGGGVALSQGLKGLFGRERPDVDLQAVEALNPSFPSGHAMHSAVVFLTLGVLSAHFAQQRRVKAYVMGAAVTTTLLVGVTRVYLGVHWPSDVLAGWSLGAAWALACWLAAWAWERPWRGWRGD